MRVEVLQDIKSLYEAIILRSLMAIKIWAEIIYKGLNNNEYFEIFDKSFNHYIIEKFMSDFL